MMGDSKRILFYAGGEASVDIDGIYSLPRSA
jgi:hypothetical protein